MHATPSQLRILQQDGIVIRFALLGSMAFVLAEIPASGSAGTAIEQLCTKPHWGFVIAGGVVFESGGRRQTILPGTSFHVPPGGAPHRFRTDGAARIAAFEPIDPDVDRSDSALVAEGFEVLSADMVGSAALIPAVISPLTEAKRIDARSWSMSSLVLTQARFGPATGYTEDWCDAQHWGLVTAGKLAIEWEDDIEVLVAGDVYHCPAGPPGHRLEAADPASVIDLTPVDAFSSGMRLASWRHVPADSEPRPGDGEQIAIAGLG